MTTDCDPEWEEDGAELYEHYRFEIDKGQSLIRIDKYLSAHIEGISRSRIQSAAEMAYILVNGKAVKSNYLVKPLDLISIVMPFRRRGVEITPENITIDVVFEDSDVLVINKPAGLVVHPGHGNYSGTLINAVAWHLGIRDKVEGDERMGVLVHRIDKNTSGLLVMAKSEEAQFRLSKQFFEHSVLREYVALVWGNIPHDSGTIDYNIGRNPNDRLCFQAFPKGTEGRHAVTHYHVLERFGYVTLITCRLDTGRTHQIRVHLNAIDHPLFNDDRYGGDRIRKGSIYAKFASFIDNCFKIMPRQALHARSLGFIHPNTKEEVQFSAPLPSDFQEVIDRWRRYTKSVGPEYAS
ncbi:MAG: RluA family pseudouridine synthase [Prevotellaceae bacterium]|jgi:23S rRNA pseudouridine1911/1915/1917 synthase|nr:RluA family pseudouridine synthase [Prevotellaceae bacterium]